MPKTITITITDAQYEALENVVEHDLGQQRAPGQPEPATTVPEFCAKAFARSVLRPALERFPTRAMLAKRAALEQARKDHEAALEPTITASISE